MYQNISGIILSGGKSTRMGENKSLLKIGDKTAIERIVDLMAGLFPKLILSANTPEEYSFLGLETVKDIYTHAGPLAGIHAGLQKSTTEKNFVISCDMQLMNEETIKFLVDYNTDRQITIAKADGFFQQLAGVYHKSCLPEIEDILTNSKIEESRVTDQKKRGCSVFKLVQTFEAEIIDAETQMPGYKPGTFFNMNKPHEFEEIRKLIDS